MIELNIGYELEYTCPKPTPMILCLNVHSSRVSDLKKPDFIITSPSVPTSGYRDGYGNWCSRIVAPAGDIRIAADTIIQSSNEPDFAMPDARQTAVEALPEESLVFLLGSRYCETDKLSDIAWQLFDNTPTGWGRVQAICDFVHSHIRFGYEFSSPTRTAAESFNDKVGVCRDYAHLAITFCRAMNIPARYCTGYLSDIGTPPPYGVMDFAAWFEACLDGNWYIFDPRNNERRIGRVLIGRGRDAADVAISNTFGSTFLKRFLVRADEVTPCEAPA
jgi:transglutaminase-like putative cysteine protease